MKNKKTLLKIFSTIVFLSGFFLSANLASADQFNVIQSSRFARQGVYIGHTITANLNKLSFGSGELMNLSVREDPLNLGFYSNSNELFLTLNVTVNGDKKQLINQNCGESCVITKNVTFTAPAAPGNYYVEFEGIERNPNGTYATPNTSYKMLYTVVAAAVTCGSSNGKALLSKPTTNLCSDGSSPAVSGSGNGPYTWTCGTASCSTVAVGTCSIVNKTVNSNYSCPSGETLNGNMCTYDAALSGGANYDVPVYPGYDGKKCTGDLSANSAVSNSRCPIYYVASAPFSGSVPVKPGFDYDNCTTLTPNLWGIHGDCPTYYISKSSFSGSVPVSQGYDYDNCTDLDTKLGYVGTCPLYYLANSPGIHGATYSCKDNSHTLSGTTCSHPATTSYSCSNVCSSLYNNTQASFTSSDSSCTTPTGPITYSLNCNCGISSTKTDLAGINYSSCTLCSLGLASTLTVNPTTNTTITSSDGKIGCSNGNVPVGTGQCSYNYSVGQAVTLSASAISPFTSNWTSGCDSISSNNCLVNMNVNKNVSNSTSCTETSNCANSTCEGSQCTGICGQVSGTKKCKNTPNGGTWKEVQP